MKKKAGILIVAILAILAIGILVFYGQTRILIGASEKFNQNELENAISCVQKENIEFKKIWYNEEVSERILASFERTDFDSENLIAIGSSFKKDNAFHENHIWILARENKSDNWRIVDNYDSEQ